MDRSPRRGRDIRTRPSWFFKPTNRLVSRPSTKFRVPPPTHLPTATSIADHPCANTAPTLTTHRTGKA